MTSLCVSATMHADKRLTSPSTSPKTFDCHAPFSWSPSMTKLTGRTTVALVRRQHQDWVSHSGT